MHDGPGDLGIAEKRDPLTGEHLRDVDLLSVHADAAATGDEDIADGNLIKDLKLSTRSDKTADAPHDPPTGTIGASHCVLGNP